MIEMTLWTENLHLWKHSNSTILKTTVLILQKQDILIYEMHKAANSCLKQYSSRC